MRKTIVVIIQLLIFIAAWALVTPDTLEDNTHLFGLIGDIEVIKGNTDWVLLGAAILSALNIWVWWPKKVKVANTLSETAKEVTKSAEAEKDPIVPKMD